MLAIAHEVAGLKWLQAPPPAAPVATVTKTDLPKDPAAPARLWTKRLNPATATAPAARTFGTALAHTHALGAPHLGCAPAHFPFPEGKMGNAPLPFVPATKACTWGKFWATYRLEPYLKPAFDRHCLSAETLKLLEKLQTLLLRGDFDHPQPRLVTTPAARLHGDLWSGNVIWHRGPTGTVGTLIDPAAQGGHAETDLACLSVFGQPFLAEIYDGYNDASALAPGWEERVGLHQLHILLIHAYLFGGGYGYQVHQVARQYV